MEHRDTLLTVAELAIALAGFASIVSVIAQRSEEPTNNRDAYRLRVMLEVALRNAAFAVLPLPFLSAFPSDPMLWRVASGVYLASALLYATFRLQTIREVGPAWVSRSSQILLVGTVSVSLANMAGLGGAHAFSLYLAALLAGLSVSGLSFMAVAVSALGLAEN
jgi:hypothetical protein